MDAEAEATLEYEPLPPVKKYGYTSPYSRVITLHPGDFDQPLYCTLELLNVNSPKEPYEALSYVWGSDHSPEPLFCDDGFLNITLNLDQALRYLRHVAKRRLIWVDAICINQRDLDERARQVEYMRLVYQHASCVIIWLGPGDDQTRAAFQFARELDELSSDMIQNQVQSRVRRLTRQDMADEKKDIHEVEESICYGRPEDTEALFKLFSFAHFERVWCIQEACAARKCICKSGDDEEDIRTFLHHVKLLIRLKGPGNDFGTLHLWELIRRKKHIGYVNDELEPRTSLGPILNLLQIIRDFKSTDPRDRIFALLGIADEGLIPDMGMTGLYESVQFGSSVTYFMQRGAARVWRNVNSIIPSLAPEFALNPALRPHYTKSVKDTFRDFTRFCVKRVPRVLDVLSHIQHGADLDESFPSWVPRFDEPRAMHFLPLEPFHAGVRTDTLFRKMMSSYVEGSRQAFRIDNISAEEEQQPDTLRLEGFKIDEIESVSHTLCYERISIEDIWKQLYSTSLFSQQKEVYPFTYEALDVAFMITICVGGIPSLDETLRYHEHFRLMDSDDIAAEALCLGYADILEWLRQSSLANLENYSELVEAARRSRRKGDADIYWRCVNQFCTNRRVFRTKSGILGLGPGTMVVGDSVVCLFGGKCPYTLRPRGRDWSFIGECYIRHEVIMSGEEMKKVCSTKDQSRVEVFNII
jgi:hypothetical protein